MMYLSRKLARGFGGMYVHWCPGCDQLHAFPVDKPGGVNGDQSWTFNGDVERPTFSPSMNISNGGCHYVLVAGVIAFCDSRDHGLGGTRVELPDLPDWVLEAARKENDLE